MVSKKNKGKIGSEPKEKATDTSKAGSEPKKNKSKKSTKKSAEKTATADEEVVTADGDNCGDDDLASAGTCTTTDTGKTRGIRGFAQMYKVLVKKAVNKKINVTYNRTGNPCGKTLATLQSYIGMLARQMVPITIASWPKVDKELKEKLWRDIQGKLVAPMQPRGHECGYYVMRFMKEIVADDTISFSTKWVVARNRKSYTQDEIDEVRIEAAEYMESLL